MGANAYRLEIIMKSKYFILCLLLLLLLLSSCTKENDKLPKDYEFYSDYTVLTTLPIEVLDCHATQGFATDDTNAFTVKIKGDESMAVIFRTRLDNGYTKLLRNGDDDSRYSSYLGHANDMALASDGIMFITSVKAGNHSIVKLRYTDDEYFKEANYSLIIDGKERASSSVSIYKETDEAYELIFKNGHTFYKGTLAKDARDGFIYLDEIFTINVNDALIDGKTLDNIGDYVNQGAEYHNDTIYFPISYYNSSIVLVYRNISTASGELQADDKLSFMITSTEFSSDFEIESISVHDGKLYFAANRVAPGNRSDCIAYFNGYEAE